MDRFIFLCVFEGSWRVWSGSMGKVLVTGLNAKQMLAANFGTKMLVIMLLVDVGMMRLRGWEEGGRGRRRGVRMMLGEQGSGIWEGREMLQKKGVAWGKEIHLKQEVSSESGFEIKGFTSASGSNGSSKSVLLSESRWLCKPFASTWLKPLRAAGLGRGPITGVLGVSGGNTGKARFNFSIFEASSSPASWAAGRACPGNSSWGCWIACTMGSP